MKVVNETELAEYQINDKNRLAGQLAVVTGASSGIGRAIAVALSRQSVRLCVIGRNPVALANTVAAAQQFSQVASFHIDLTLEEKLEPLVRYIQGEGGKLDILIHSAGVIYQNLVSRAGSKELDLQYATNVRAPYMLTQRLRSCLAIARGQIVFINSSSGLTTKRPDIMQYSATKHALRAIADGVREEVNPEGIRVLTLYLGRTATPMQENLCRLEGRDYKPESLLQPEDVAEMIISALSLPQTAEVTDISIRPMQRPY